MNRTTERAMPCHQVRALAGRYADGMLPEDERQAVTRHLLTCPDCAAAVTRQRLATAAVASMAPSRPGDRIRAAVLDARRTSSSRRSLLRTGAKAVALGGAGALGVVTLARLGQAARRRQATFRSLPTAPPTPVSTTTPAPAASATPRAAAATPATALPADLRGRRLAFVGYEDVRLGFSGRSHLWVMTPSDGSTRDVAQRNDTYLTEPAWSANGTRLYYVDNFWTIAALDLATGRHTTVFSYPQLTNGGIADLHPAPDGQRLAFVVYGGMLTPPLLMLLQLGQHQAATLLQGTVQGNTPSDLSLVGWQAGTGLLLYQEQSALWTLDPTRNPTTTKATTRIATLPAVVPMAYGVSPDGRQLLQVFDVDPHDQGTAVRRTDLYRIQIGTGQTTNLTDGTLYNEATPSWSPDGAWVAFTASPKWVDGRPRPARDLWIMRADGSARQNLTQGTYGDVGGAAAWTPRATVTAMATKTAPQKGTSG